MHVCCFAFDLILSLGIPLIEKVVCLDLFQLCFKLADKRRICLTTGLMSKGSDLEFQADIFRIRIVDVWRFAPRFRSVTARIERRQYTRLDVLFSWSEFSSRNDDPDKLVEGMNVGVRGLRTEGFNGEIGTGGTENCAGVRGVLGGWDTSAKPMMLSSDSSYHYKPD